MSFSIKNKFDKLYIMKKLTIVLSAALILFTAGCQKKNQNNAAVIHDLKLSQVSQDSQQLSQIISQWHITNKRIYVLFGYGFNSPETVEKLKLVLENRYGLDEDDGLICPVIYPDNFKHNGKAIATELYHMLAESEKDIAGVLILGAPDTTNIALGRLQDFWDMNVPYPIIALFPQDDVEGLHSTCDLVIDKSQKTQSGTEEESNEFLNEIAEETPGLIVDTLDYMITLNGTLPKDSDLQVHAKQMLPGRNLSMYVDPETGIRAINHFVLETK